MDAHRRLWPEAAADPHQRRVTAILGGRRECEHPEAVPACCRAEHPGFSALDLSRAQCCALLKRCATSRLGRAFFGGHGNSLHIDDAFQDVGVRAMEGIARVGPFSLTTTRRNEDLFHADGIFSLLLDLRYRLSQEGRP